MIYPSHEEGLTCTSAIRSEFVASRGFGCAFTGTSIGAATTSATHALLLEVNEGVPAAAYKMSTGEQDFSSVR